MVHAELPDKNQAGIKLLDKAGQIQPEKLEQWTANLKLFNYDILIVGHTHQFFLKTLLTLWSLTQVAQP